MTKITHGLGSRGLYYIQRTEINDGKSYRYELCNALSGAVVCTTWAPSLSPPPWLKQRMYELNYRAINHKLKGNKDV